MSTQRAGRIDHPGGTPDAAPGFTRRVLVVAAVVVLAVGLGAAFVLAADVFFLFFLAVLLAILLRAAGDALARHTPLGPGWALAVVVLMAAGLLAGGGYLVGSVVAGQVDRLAAEWPGALARGRDFLRQWGWGRWVLGHAPPADQLVFGGRSNTAATVASFFSTTLGVLGNLLVLVFLTLYLAAAPQTYMDGLLRLVPPRRRERAGQVVSAVGYHLRWWLVGRAVAMVVLGLIVGVGLWLAGVPQFLALALLAAVLNSIPYLGSVGGAVPGILLALVQGPTAALWAAGVYLLAQSVDNYLVTPLVQRRTVNMPPVLTILAVVLAGVLFGVLGVIVAAPLALVVLLAVKMLYVEDVLGDRMDVAGAARRPVPG